MIRELRTRARRAGSRSAHASKSQWMGDDDVTTLRDDAKCYVPAGGGEGAATVTRHHRCVYKRNKVNR